MIAIDPGASGGIAIRKLMSVEAHSMPKTDSDVVTALAEALPQDRVSTAGESAYLEELVKYTGRNMPSSAMAVYASNWGIIKGALIAMGFRIIMVPPKKWQAALGLGSAKGLSKTEWKNKLKQRAQELFPEIDVTLATADALLILEAAYRGHLG